MIDAEQHPYVEWIAREARRPVVTEQATRERIMSAGRAEPVPERRRHGWQRVFDARSVRMSPAGTALIAAGLVGVGVIAGMFANNRDARSPGGPSQMAVVPQSQLPVSDS